MHDMPDVAGKLFTNDYRAVKLRGQKPRRPGPGTGSCFDATDPLEVHNAAKRAAKTAKRAAKTAEKPPQPYWEGASYTYRLRSAKQEPHDFIKAHSGVPSANASQLAHLQKKGKPSPPSPGAYKPRQNLPHTAFRRAYERADLPVAVEHRGLKNVIRWRADIAKLDYAHFLPLFFDGIRETQDPFRFLAIKGCEDLLEVVGEHILPILPYIVLPLKRALDTQDEQVMINGLKLLQKLVMAHELVGQVLIPHFRQLLPVCCKFARKNKHLGDAIDYAQHEGNCLGEVVNDTLNLLELRGGPNAFINIKYMVPIYESAYNY